MIVVERQERLDARLRADLIQSYHEGREPACLVVKNPRTGRFFRFGEIEAFILGRLSGETTAEQLQNAVQEQFGAPLPRQTLDQFVAKLGRLGLLETGQPVLDAKTPIRGRIRGNLLYLRFPGLDPDRLLTWMERKLRFLFTTGFVALSGAAVIWGLIFTILHWDDIARDIPRLYNVGSLLVMYLTVVGVIVFHEFAHGLTCKHFGGNVREMGFMLLYFQPAFYCNVSDAWLFPKKSQRLWVKSAFNLNPLIKLDGYYLLSDLLEVPNLRQRAVSYWGNSGTALLRGVRAASRRNDT